MLTSTVVRSCPIMKPQPPPLPGPEGLFPASFALYMPHSSPCPIRLAVPPLQASLALLPVPVRAQLAKLWSDSVAPTVSLIRVYASSRL